MVAQLKEAVCGNFRPFQAYLAPYLARQEGDLRMRKATLAILLTLFVSTTAAVRADDAPKGDRQPGDKGGEKAAAAPPAPRKFITHHRFTAGGVDIPYTAAAEDIDLKDRDGKPTARFFTISYLAEGVKRQEDR